MMELFERHSQMTCADITVLWDDDVSRELSAAEQQALTAHLAECETCRMFVKLASNLSLLPDELPENEINSAIHSVMETAAQHRMRSHQRIPRWGAVAAVSAMAALAIVGVLMAYLSATAETSKPMAGFTCIASEPKELSTGVFLSYCDEPISNVLVENHQVTVPLPNGTIGLFVDPNRPDHRKVVVKTPQGMVRVKGTVFTVQAESENTRVEVFRGVVEMTPAGDPKPFDVASGHAAEMASRNIVSLTTPQTEVLRQKLIPLANQKESGTSLEDDTSTTGMLSGAPADSPTTHRAKNGNRRAKQVTRGAHHKSADKSKSSKETMYTLIQSAQSCLIDRDWDCAATQYKTVLANYSQRPESLAVLISLAKIELRYQGSPKDALAHYKAYWQRAPNGPLAEEAHFGMAQAYRKLGRTDEEKRSLRGFIERYPESSLIQKAHGRLQQLEK